MHTSAGISLYSFQSFFRKTFTTILLLTMLEPQQLFAQFTDSFADEDFLNNPAWIGTQSKFIATSSILKLQAPALADFAYLSTSSTALHDAVWEFYVQLDFNPSSSNYARVYLASDQSDFSASLHGYYVMIGNTSDEISLYRQDGLTKTEIIDGLDGRVNVSVVMVKIKVTRDTNGNWQLYSDVGLTNTYTTEGTSVDNTYSSSEYFGVFCLYSSTRSDKFSFDDFSVTGAAFVDKTPPTLESLEVLSSTALVVKFSESLDSATAVSAENYFVTGVGNPSFVTHVAADSLVLIFENQFVNGAESTLSISGLRDLAGNEMLSVDQPFVFFESSPVTFKDIVVTEIYADYSPSNGLPEAEFVEILNRSNNPIDLGGWTLSDGTYTAVFPTQIILPGEYLILSNTASKAMFLSYGEVLALTNFPTLNNSGDKLTIKDSEGTPVDFMEYTLASYNDGEKDGGGWTIEIRDPDNFCLDEVNWRASVNTIGGTPGKLNSVDEDLHDVESPRLVTAIQIDSTTIQLGFDEKLQANAPEANAFSISPFVPVSAVEKNSDQSIIIITSTNVDPSLTYKISVNSIRDCSGNLIAENYSSVFLNLDTIAVSLLSIASLNATNVKLVFSESVTEASSSDILKYTLEETNSHPTEIIKRSETELVIVFAEPLINGKTYTLGVEGAEDNNGNRATLRGAFRYFQPVSHVNKDVIITEIFCDPSPSVALPEIEFIEIFNRSENPVQLQQWTITDPTTTGVFGDLILMPGEYLIVTSSSGKTEYASFGAVTVPSKFPSLNNSGDVIVLRDENGVMIDSLLYDDAWYFDEESAEGGVTLELIDPGNICAVESNWTSSESARGGTPGTQNSVFAEKPDLISPRLKRVAVFSPQTIQLIFDEKLQQAPPSISLVEFAPAVSIAAISFADPSLKSLNISLNHDLMPRTLYTVQMKNISDCAGNVSVDQEIIFALPEKAEQGDLVINEILFNPPTAGFDFLEIYNNSEKYIDLRELYLANVYDGALSNFSAITDEQVILGPQSHMAFCENISWLGNQYPIAPVEHLFQVQTLPSMPDEGGEIALTDSAGEVIDDVRYLRSYHSVFVKDEEGVSLERISPQQSSLSLENWKSASASSGYGTPGYANSNAWQPSSANEKVDVSPKVFEPRSGEKDFAMISYHFERGGFIANVKIFDQQGRVIKTLTQNELLGVEGFMRWDGDTDDGYKARVGYYVINFEIFDDHGNVETIRKAVAIASRF